MFILASLSSGFEILLMSYTSVYENSELKSFKNIKSLVEMSNNWPNYLYRTNAYKTFKSCW